MESNVFATFLIVFREALEAGLICGIIFTVLQRMQASRYYGHIFASIGLALVASVGAAYFLANLTSQAQGNGETIIEGVVSLIACAVLTHMILWMKEQSKKIKSDIESKLESAVLQKEIGVMIALPFVAVFREGAETVLFLKAVSIQSSQSASFIGGAAGLGLAVLITVLIFAGGKRISLKPFFQYTGILLLFISAGLLAYGIHELEEVGWLNGIIYPIWDINHILNEKEGIGSFLKALFGYNGNPSLVEFVAYISYLVIVGRFYFSNKKNDSQNKASDNPVKSYSVKSN